MVANLQWECLIGCHRQQREAVVPECGAFPKDLDRIRTVLFEHLAPNVVAHPAAPDVGISGIVELPHDLVVRARRLAFQIHGCPGSRRKGILIDGPGHLDPARALAGFIHRDVVANLDRKRLSIRLIFCRRCRSLNEHG